MLRSSRIDPFSNVKKALASAAPKTKGGSAALTRTHRYPPFTSFALRVLAASSSSNRNRRMKLICI